MKRINKTSKVGEMYLRCYKEAKATSVKQFYNSPSVSKIRAEESCLQTMWREQGQGYKVISGNSFYFTAAWITEYGLRIETPKNSYLVY